MRPAQSDQRGKVKVPRPNVIIVAAIIMAVALMVASCQARYVFNLMYDSNPPEAVWPEMPAR